jgi:ribosomal protein S18 acetylase RimI-like enzyme
MTDPPVVTRFAPSDWRSYRDLRLRALADSPDAFASTLDAERTRPDAEWARRLELAAAGSTDLPLVARVGGPPAGLAWGRLDAHLPGVAHLYQVWVAPEFRGRGVGRMLLDAVIQWARAAGARELVLDVTRGDTPATRLYLRAGFRPAGEPEPLREGSALEVQPMRLTLGDADAPSP